MTQMQVSERLDVSQSAISQWLLGRTVPSCESLTRMARRFQDDQPEIALLAAQALRKAGEVTE